MFFSQIVLAKRGSLGKIWLAGHWDKKLAKKVVFKTNIPKSVKFILRPHVPMALRMTSHLLLGVVRIYSKKAKYLLSDCTEAVVKLKGLSKTVSKIDLPTEQDPQSLLITGPRNTESKPQVYQEVDRFLRNIDIRDLVVDPLYDPNKLEPSEKPNYSDVFGQNDITDDAMRNMNTPMGLGLFDNDMTPSAKKPKSDELRRDEIDQINMTPQHPLFQQFKTPTTPTTPGGKSMIDGLSENINPLYDISRLPTTPKQDDLLMGDNEKIEFDEGFNQQQGGIMDQDDFRENGGMGDIPDYPQNDMGGDYPESKIGGEEDMANTTVTGLDGTTTTQEKSKEDIIREALEKYGEQKEVEKDKVKRRRHIRESDGVLTKRELKRFTNPKSLTIERQLLPNKLSIVINKTKEIPLKQRMLSAIRQNISNTFFRTYGEILQNRYPKILQQAEAPFAQYLRSRMNYSQMVQDPELLQNIEADGTRNELGIPSFTEQPNLKQDQEMEEILLKSINNRIIGTKGGDNIAPSEKKKLKVQELTEEEEERINALRGELDARNKEGLDLYYKPETNQLLRRDEQQEQEIQSATSPSSKKDEDELRKQFGDDDFGAMGMGGQDYLNPLDEDRNAGLLFNDDDDYIQQPRDSFESAQRPQPYNPHLEKRIWSKKTRNMHTILDQNFQRKQEISFSNDIIKPIQNQPNNTTRFAAACYFYELLILKTKALIDLDQNQNDSNETYPDIKITKTEFFDNVDDFKVVEENDGM